MTREEQYKTVIDMLKVMLEPEPDWVVAMATVACELHHAFDHFHWTGFYRVIAPEMLAVGPYQGGHGCFRIPFSNGVCGAVARSGETIRLDDVNTFKHHIACSSSTVSEIVVPIVAPAGTLFAVLDVDSDDPAAFDLVDQKHLEQLCNWLGRQYNSIG